MTREEFVCKWQRRRAEFAERLDEYKEKGDEYHMGSFSGSVITVDEMLADLEKVRENGKED